MFHKVPTNSLRTYEEGFWAGKLAGEKSATEQIKRFLEAEYGSREKKLAEAEAALQAEKDKWEEHKARYALQVLKEYMK